jgi:hypothetical protein
VRSLAVPSTNTLLIGAIFLMLLVPLAIGILGKFSG